MKSVQIPRRSCVHASFNAASHFYSQPPRPIGRAVPVFGWLALCFTATAAAQSAPDITVGNAPGDNATYTLPSGVLTQNGQARLGNQAGSVGTVIASGPGTVWTLTPRLNQPLLVGWGGTGNLYIEDGAQVNTTAPTTGLFNEVASLPGSHGNVVIDGAGSQFTSNGDLYIGYAGVGSIVISGGGVADTRIGLVGFDPGSAGSSAEITGTGSEWRATTFLVGATGSSGVVDVLNGGRITSASNFSVGNGSANIVGPGSTVSAAANSLVSNGNINVSGGGQLLVGGTFTAGFAAGLSGTLTVDGPGSLVTTGASTSIGSAGTGGLSVTNGGTVQTGTFATLGTAAGISGSGVITGAGSSWTIGGIATVGASGTGTLTVGSQGTVSAASITLASATGSTGTLDIGAAPGSTPASAGALNVPSIAFGSGAATLNLNHTDSDYVFAPAMTGGTLATASINQLAGNTSLTGDSNAFGGTTNVTGGTLRVNGTLGNAGSQINVSNGATLGGAGTIGGNVAVGDGVLSPGNSPGTLTVNGNLTLSSGSTLNYELGAANTAGGSLNDLTVVHGNLTLDGTLDVTQSAGGVYGAGIYRLIDYAGNLTDNGLELGSMPAGSNNYLQTSVAHQVNLINTQGLVLSWWDGDAGGRNDGAIAGGNGTWTTASAPSSATLERWTQADGLINAPYQNGTFAIFAGSPGTVTVDNSAGQVRVSGMQFATSGYRIEGGSIELTAGTDAIRVGDGTSAGAGTTATIASELTGAGQLDKVDLGTLVLTGASNYTGGTTISSGTLQLGDGGTTGSLVGDVTNNGMLAFNRSDASTFAGRIDGTGRVNQAGTGSTTLTGINTYTGGTLVSAGTLIGSATSFGSGAITNNAALVIDQGGDATMANAINGSGTLAKTGAGTLSYTGTGTLTGPTTVTTGTLAMNGSIANSAVAVAPGATLAGTGTVGATTLAGGATVAPGNGSIGTLTMHGNFNQAPGAIYQVQVAPGTNASSRINVLGSASIANGAVLNVGRASDAAYALDARYTVLNATGGVSGAYTLAGDTRTAFVQLEDSYDASNVYLTAQKVRSFASAGGTPNEVATGQGLDTLPATSPLANAVAVLPNDTAARTAFDQLSGEIYASLNTATLENSRFVREAALQRLRAADCAPGSDASIGAPSPDATTDQPRDMAASCVPAANERTAWGQVFGSWDHVRGDGNAQGIDSNTGGFFLGADTALNAGWRVGVLGGYSHSTSSTDQVGSAQTDSYHVGVYGGNQWGNTALRLGASSTWNRNDASRSVVFSGYADKVQAGFDSRTTQLFGELGQRVELGRVALEPFAQMAHVMLHSDGFSETGGAAALNVSGDSADPTFSTLGARFTADLSGSASLRGSLGWQHTFGDVVSQISNSFPNGSPFTVSGVPLARNAAAVELGIAIEPQRNLQLSASYAGQFARRLSDNGVKVSLGYTF